MARRSDLGGGGFGRPHLIALALIAQLGLGGCYNYTRVEPGAVPPGSDVRISVARGVPLSVGTNSFREDGGVVEGKLLQGPSSDSLICDVLLDAPVDGGASRGLRGTVSIPAGAVESVEVRSLDKLRTGGLIGAGVVLAWVIVENSFDIHNAKEGTDPSGNVDNARITLFRLAW